MKNVKLLAYFSLILLVNSCKTPAEYFKRKNIVPAINSNCSAFKDGIAIDATNYISVSPEDYQYLMEYFEDKEYRLYICLKYKRKCR